MTKITTPTLILDEKRARRNIEKVQKKIKGTATKLRPHFKTHQSREIGRWYKDYGVDRITASSIEMAEYFAEDWDDITVAFPANILEIDRINALAGRIQLNLIAVSTEILEMLSQQLTSSIGIFIKVDVGTHRTGVNPSDTALIDRMLDLIDASGHMSFKGFLGHAGHSYGGRSEADILAVHQESMDIMSVLRARYTPRYPELVISLGDTPTCSVVQDFSGIDEIRPGNYIYYDVMMTEIGACTMEEPAVAVACPIVALHEERNLAIIYGGGVHFSKDRCETADGTSYGQVMHREGNGWGAPITGMYVKGLSQEHGKVHIPADQIGKHKVGDLLYILPVHSCMTADLLKQVMTTEGQIIQMMNGYR